MSASNRFDDQQERLEEDAVVWLVRLTSGAATDSDRREAATWRPLSPAHDQAFQRVERLWAGIEPLRGAVRDREGVAAATGAAPPLSMLNRREKGHQWIRRMAIAASVAALAVSLAVTTGALPPFWADARTGTGERLALPLSDGSRILLNTQAAVSVHYSKESRQVDLLAGEASFQVAKDPARPFIVRTKNGQVRAVGTEFLVRETRNAAVVTVTEGVVDVSASGDRADAPTRVHAGQLVRYGASGVSRVEPADLRVVTAWQRGKLIFEAEPLTTVVEEINRYRPGRVTLLGETLARHPVSGVFDLDRLDSAVTTIEQTLPVTTVRITNRFVFFR